MKTIGDMRNENYFFCRCKKFEYIHDFEQVFLKKMTMCYWKTKYFFVYESMYVYYNIVCGLLYEYHEMI